MTIFVKLNPCVSPTKSGHKLGFFQATEKISKVNMARQPSNKSRIASSWLLSILSTFLFIAIYISDKSSFTTSEGQVFLKHASNNQNYSTRYNTTLVGNRRPRIVICNENLSRKVNLRRKKTKLSFRGQNFTAGSRIQTFEKNDHVFSSTNNSISNNDLSVPLSWRLNASDPDCNPPNEFRTFYPTCNIVHEIDLANSSEQNHHSFILTAKGSLRIVWSINQTIPLFPKPFVLKMLHMKRDVDIDSIEHNRMDSTILEKLTFSPFIIHEYGFCGLTTLNEQADTEIGKVLEKEKDLSSLDVLKIARDVATGLSHIHNVAASLKLAHNDINPANILFKNGTVKYHDFNLAVALPYNQRKNQTCKFPATHFTDPKWRSPEEIRNETHVSEKVDIYAMGNIFFMALTKARPWGRKSEKEPLSRGDVYGLKVEGQLPNFPDDIEEQSEEDLNLKILLMVTKWCYSPDVDKRPSARQVADTLREVVEVVKRGTVDIKELIEKIPLFEILKDY